MNPKLSIVAPVYNEAENLTEFYRYLKLALDKTAMSYEILFINDGSTDASVSKIQELRREDKNIKLLNFSRNFGHQIAVKAGIDYSKGDAVIVMDTDLQDPPEAILDMIAKWREGYEVVYAVRVSREGESFFKKVTANLYYRLIQKIAQVKIPLDAGDYRLIARPVADVIRSIQEKQPYIRGLTSWVGFSQIGIPIKRQPRFAGSTKYSLKKMLKLAWTGITHFSFLPLQISTYLGIVTSILCLCFIAQALYVRIVLNIAVQGWTSLMVAVLFIGAVQLITLGILGSYLARNYDETRSRPLYVIRQKEGIE